MVSIDQFYFSLGDSVMMQAGLFLSNNVNVIVALYYSLVPTRALLQMKMKHSTRTYCLVKFYLVKAVFQCQTKDHKAAVAENVCLARNSAPFYNRVSTNSPLV